MANIENLTMAGIAIDSKEKAQALGAKGGRQKGINARIRKSFAQIGEGLALCKPSKELIAKAKKLFPDIPEEEINNKLIIMGRLVEKAMKGDLKAIEMFRDTIGEKPTDKTEITGVDGEALNVKYELLPATKEALEKAKKDREIIEE